MDTAGARSSEPDQRIRRAAGVVLWRLKKGHTIDKAVADASAREPELTPAEIQYAVDWADAAMQYIELARMHCGTVEIGRDDHGNLVPVFPGGQPPACSPAELREKSGLQRFIDENR